MCTHQYLKLGIGDFWLKKGDICDPKGDILKK